MARRTVGERLNAVGEAAPGRLARNAASGASRHVVSALLALAVTPYALRVLGAERFGLWAIGGAVLATVRLLDLGIERSVARQVAAASAREDPEGIAGAVGSAVPLALGLGGLATLAVWMARGPLVDTAFAVPGALRAEAALVFVGCALVAWLEGALVPYRAALVGVGRMDLASGIDAGQRAASAVGTVVVLGLGWGLMGLVVKNLVMAAGAGLLSRRLAIGRAPSLAGWPTPRADAARDLLAFGGHVQTVNLGAVALELGAKVLLARYAGLAGVAVWELATRVTQQLAAVLLSAVLAVFPEAAALGAASEGPAGNGSRERLASLYRRAAGAMTVAVVAGFGMLAVLAAPFVAAWLGPEHAPVAGIILVLCAGWSVAILSTPAAMVAQATGRARDVALASLVTPVVGLGAAAMLAPQEGVGGVAAGVAAGLVAGALAMAVMFKRTSGLPWRDLAPLNGRVAAALAAGLAAAGLAGRGLPLGILWVAAAAALGTALALGVARSLGVALPSAGRAAR